MRDDNSANNGETFRFADGRRPDADLRGKFSAYICSGYTVRSRWKNKLKATPWEVVQHLFLGLEKKEREFSGDPGTVWVSLLSHNAQGFLDTRAVPQSVADRRVSLAKRVNSV
jgi:hypothetical protein